MKILFISKDYLFLKKINFCINKIFYFFILFFVFNNHLSKKNKLTTITWKNLNSDYFVLFLSMIYTTKKKNREHHYSLKIGLFSKH